MPHILEEQQSGEYGRTGLKSGGQKGQLRAEVTGSQVVQGLVAVLPEMGTLGGL